MRGIAERMANEGFSVEMPLLPGHGTSVENLMVTRFEDWADAAEAAYQSLAARTEHVVVAGLSMGGTLSCWLAERHPELTGLVLINPLVEPLGDEMTDGLKALLDAGIESIDAIGSDIAKEGIEERAYPSTPVACLSSLFAAVDEVSAALDAISCPILLLSSKEDHVVTPSNGDHLMAHTSGPIEQIVLERSYHVATLDHDASLIEDQAAAFVERLITKGDA